jgi:hypothetical protein
LNDHCRSTRALPRPIATSPTCLLPLRKNFEKEKLGRDEDFEHPRFRGYTLLKNISIHWQQPSRRFK